MSARRRSARRRPKRKYLVRRLLAMVFLAALLLLLLAAVLRGCGGSGTSPETGSRLGDDDAGESGGEAPPEKPYAAVPPPPGAKELGYETTSGTTGPEMGARSVPPGEVLLAGEDDASDGPLKDNRLVAYYGTPLSNQMGVLGESGPEEMMDRLKEQAAEYSRVDPERPAVPTVELIASVAQRVPGPDGLYLSRTPPEVIEEYARLAEKNEALLLLDVQLGRDTVLSEVRALLPFLERPHVHLAIDTEYSVGPGQVPGVDLGSVDGSEIQDAVALLDRLVERENIPDKVVVVHQFETGIVTNRRLIRPTENVEVVLNADGFGAPAAKLAKYDLLVGRGPVQYGGFKLFYRQDAPLLSPERVVRLDPAPAIVNYQ